jgi:hypothetical protein
MIVEIGGHKISNMTSCTISRLSSSMSVYYSYWMVMTRHDKVKFVCKSPSTFMMGLSPKGILSLD